MVLRLRPCSAFTVTAPGAPEMSPPNPSHCVVLPLLDNTSLGGPAANDEPLPSSVQVLAGSHAYTLLPGGAVVRKKNCPTAHEAGRVDPVCIGLVDDAAEKSTLLLCVRKSTDVWATPVAPKTVRKKVKPATSLHLFICSKGRNDGWKPYRLTSKRPLLIRLQHAGGAEQRSQSPQVTEIAEWKSCLGV